MGWFKSTEEVYYGNQLIIDVSGKFKFAFGIQTTGEQRGYIAGHAKATFRLNGELYDIRIYLYSHVGTYKDLNEAYSKILDTDRSVIMKALQDDTVKAINTHFRAKGFRNAKEEFEKKNKEFTMSFNVTANESDIKK